MSTLWEDIKRALKDGYITAAGKTEELTKIGKTRLDIASLRRKIGKKTNELGSKTYQLVTGKKAVDIVQDKGIQKLVEEIKRLEADVKENEKKIQDIKTQEQGKIKQRKSQR